MTKIKLFDRFKKKFIQRSIDECWHWTAGRQTKGYGQFWDGTKLVLAHRWSYEYFVGEIPLNLTIDHTCRNHICVNPNHLEPVTSKVNTLRGIGVTSVNAAKTHCKYGHEFTESNTWIERTKWGNRRKCRVCVNRIYQQRYLRRKNKLGVIVNVS